MLTRSPAQPSTANGTQRRVGGAESTEKSVIGNDLKIIGQGLKIIGRGVLQVDGEIEGDVQATEVIVGEKGRVSGMICGRTVALQASSNVEADVHHMSLLIEQGAMFDGRSRRAASETDLNAVAARGGHQS